MPQNRLNSVNPFGMRTTARRTPVGVAGGPAMDVRSLRRELREDRHAGERDVADLHANRRIRPARNTSTREPKRMRPMRSPCCTLIAVLARR